MIYKINGKKTYIEAWGIIKESEKSVTYKSWEFRDSRKYHMKKESEKMEIDYYKFRTENGGIEIEKRDTKITVFVLNEGTLIIQKSRNRKTEKTDIRVKKNKALARELLGLKNYGTKYKKGGITKEEVMILEMKLVKKTKEISSWIEKNIDNTESVVYEIRQEGRPGCVIT